MITSEYKCTRWDGPFLLIISRLSFGLSDSPSPCPVLSVRLRTEDERKKKRRGGKKAFYQILSSGASKPPLWVSVDLTFFLFHRRLLLNSFFSRPLPRLLGPGGRSKLRTLRDTYIHASFPDENKPVASCSKRNEIFVVPINSLQFFFPLDPWTCFIFHF